MTSQERVATILSGGVPDRVPIYDSYWGATIERWRREGLPQDVSPADYFEHDIVRIGGDYSMQFPVRRSGYLSHSDHSVPDDVSFANYCRVIELVRRYGAYGSAFRS